MENEDLKDIVRRGYDALSVRYDEVFGGETKYRPWIDDVRGRVPPGGTVVDLGCGSGVPLARELVDSGYRVIGIDISEAQIQRARSLVPGAEFRHADATAVRLAPESVDAVVSLYALIHIPLDEQPPLLERVADWLEPGGCFLATYGP